MTRREQILKLLGSRTTATTAEMLAALDIPERDGRLVLGIMARCGDIRRADIQPAGGPALWVSAFAANDRRAA